MMSPADCARLRLAPSVGLKKLEVGNLGCRQWGVLTVARAVPAKSGQVAPTLVERGLAHRKPPILEVKLDSC